MAGNSDDDLIVERIEAGSADPPLRDEAEDSDSSSIGESTRRNRKKNDSSLKSDSSNQINMKRPATASSGEQAGSAKKLRQEEPSNQKKSHKVPRAFVWKYGHFKKNEETNKAECQHCSASLCAQSTSSLKYHLEKVHKIVEDTSQTAAPGKTKSAVASEKSQHKNASVKHTQSKMEQHGFGKPVSKSYAKGLTRRIAEFLALDMKATHTVEGIGFKRLLSYMAPGYQIPVRTSFSRTHIPELANEVYR